jgi:hypothetical protein
MKTSFAYKFTTCIVHTTNEYDVTNARYVSPHFRQRFFCIPLRLNWLNKKTGRGDSTSPPSSRGSHRITQRIVPWEGIVLTCHFPPYLSFSPKSNVKSRVYTYGCVCMCGGKEKTCMNTEEVKKMPRMLKASRCSESAALSNLYTWRIKSIDRWK